MLSLLGVNCQTQFKGTALSLNFETLPFVDSTGRHTTSGGVLSGGSTLVVAGQAGPAGGVAINGNIKDFSLVRNFDVSCTINMTTHVGADKVIWTLRNGTGDPYPIEVYVNNSGHVVAYLNAFGTSLSSSSSGYTIPLSTPVEVRLTKLGTAVSLSCGGVLRASGTAGVLVRSLRRLYIGYLPGVPLSFGGTIDDFSWVNS